MEQSIQKLGFFAGIAAFCSTVGFCIVQAMQLMDILTFPLDQVLIYSFSLAIVIPFLLEMLAFHHLTTGDKKFWSHAALIAAMFYAAFVMVNYVVQLATVLPAMIWGRGQEIENLAQTPHSVFWDLDALGYLWMGLSTLAAVPALAKTGFQKWVRISFIAHSCTTPLIAFIYFYPVFSTRLLLLGSLWGVTAPLSMLAMGILIKRMNRPKKIENAWSN